MKRHKLNGHAAIAEAVGNSLSEYLEKLDGEPADNLYELVIGSVEKSLISDVLTRTKGTSPRRQPCSASTAIPCVPSWTNTR